MTCEPLADTGAAASVLMILVLGAGCLLLGFVGLLYARRCGRVTPTVLLLFLVVGGGLTFALVTPSPALAELPACRGATAPSVPGPTAPSVPVATSTASATSPTSAPSAPSPPLVTITASATAAPPTGPNSLTITQTSVMTGMAPGVPPAPITGRVVNNGFDDTYLTAIDVEVDEVIKHPGAVHGRCDASDYRLIAPRMMVGQPLLPGGSIDFEGASIGFQDKPVNQDACRRATVALRYTAVPR